MTKSTDALAPTEIVEQIAQQWDGCMYDAPGESIDIGEAIRSDWNRRATTPKASAPAPESAPQGEREAFEEFVRQELGDVAVMDEGRYISAKIQKYWLTWQAGRASIASELDTPALSEVMPPEVEGRLSLWLTLGKELHPHTVNLVVRFARALAAKLADAEKKYGYSDGWRSPDWMDECRTNLMEHIAKGDPRDVAAYCAFLWYHDESTAKAPESAPHIDAAIAATPQEPQQ